MLLPLVLILAGFYVGWNIGANDAANCIGTTVGARILSFPRAALLMGVFVILGGVFQGHAVMNTVGKGIVITSEEAYEDDNHGEPAPEKIRENFPSGVLPDLAVLVALMSAGVFVTIATVSSVPVSTSQAIVGGVAGVGIGIVGFDDSFFRSSVLLKIGACWFTSPILTMALAFLIYSLLNRVLRRAKAVAWSSTLSIAVVISACYVSFSLGANDVGNAIGPLLNRYPGREVELALLGGVAMAVGALTLGRRVTHTVGKSITPLDLPGALSAQVSAGFGVHVFSMLGIPVSTSQAIVGAVIGVGLTKGANAVSKRKIVTIIVGWVLVPACAATVAAVSYRLVIQFLS